MLEELEKMQKVTMSQLVTLQSIDPKFTEVATIQQSLIKCAEQLQILIIKTIVSKNSELIPE